MKKTLYSMLMITIISVAGWGCAAATAVVGVTPSSTDVSSDTDYVQVATDGTAATDAASEEASKIDFTKNFTLQIKEDVREAIAGASTMQDEINKVKKIADKYAELASTAETQVEKDLSSGWVCAVWDSELNNLCSRVAGIADDAKREKLLEDQNNWNAIKDEVMLSSINGTDDNMNIYSTNESDFMVDIIQNRCNILANEIAKSRDEKFDMPKRSIYGTFIDNQGTENVCSSLVTREGKGNNDNEAIISIHQMALLDGTFKDKGNGELEFIGNRNNIKGIIKINGWDDATLEITQSNDEIYNVGLCYTFDFAF